ncbi:hypothetical protein ACH5RR_032760, partial [Cinchona calisaya]
QWNIDLVRQHVSGGKAEAILSLPLGGPNVRDRWNIRKPKGSTHIEVADSGNQTGWNPCSESGLKGLFRGSSGFQNPECFLFGACRSFDCTNSSVAGVELQLCGFSLEGDAKNIIKELQLIDASLSLSSPMLEDIRSLLIRLNVSSILWVATACNNAAHHVAQLGLVSSARLLWLNEPPVSLQRMLLADNLPFLK